MLTHLRSSCCKDAIVGGVTPGLGSVTLVASSATPAPPSIALLGPALVVVALGVGYERCPMGGAPVDGSLECDRGASASDVIDGDLTPLVTACQVPGRWEDG
jgi:hypothetical protein